ncbi:MAG: 5-methyltetrahydrofolate--homocysteine methyltransferase [Verrucomicrobia bacterium]|nr:MAG: 5-methyltetrahydrofolate--homocysteine methyltransferase [Verrucomicrobiota bacterium]
MKPTEQDLLIFDGATGTNLQRLNLPASVWEGKEGCNELLNVTAPEAIQDLHRSFLDAGAQVLETNTFGASRIVLAEYGLENRVAEINAAAVANARAAIAGRPDRWVCGSLGPGTKLPSLGHIEPEKLAIAYREQIIALVEAGVDLLILETCQDLFQIKLGLIACFETLEKLGREIPVLVSVTVERTGTMLVGSDIAAAAVTVEPFPVFAFGLNCATGPTDMTSHIHWLQHNWPRRISVMPNQGLPEIVNGQTAYRLTPNEFARQMKPFVAECGVSIVGGCCGTTPEHIRALTESLRGIKPAARSLET